MRIFIGLITLSATASSIVGIVTQDIFNSFAIYSPLAVTSWAISEWFNGRKNKKQLLEEK